MSTTQVSFRVKLNVGDETVPLASEIVIGQAASKQGVQKGFLFTLDGSDGAPPVTVNLGHLIALVEDKLGAGAGSLAQNPGLDLLSQAFPGKVSRVSFNAGSTVRVDVRAFALNSSSGTVLFSISADVDGAIPTEGLVPLAGPIAGWLTIDKLAISLSATRTGA